MKKLILALYIITLPTFSIAMEKAHRRVQILKRQIQPEQKPAAPQPIPSQSLSLCDLKTYLAGMLSVTWGS